MSGAVLITGSAGFLGSALAAALERDGVRVVRCGRTPERANREWRPYDLAWRRLPNDLFAGIDTIVHAAFASANRATDSFTLNVDAAQTLLSGARSYGAKMVFVSSLAAHGQARSIYGRQKLAIEALLGESDLTVRPGLIVGHGGLFGRMASYIRSGKPVPLVDLGRQPVQSVYIDDVAHAITALIASGASGKIVLAESPSVSYREFFAALARRLGYRERFVRVPSLALLTATTIANTLGVTLPVERDNVLGLLEMRYMKPTPLEPLGLPALRPYKASIDAFCTAVAG